MLLPGLLATRRVWQNQIEALSDVADIVVPELYDHDSMGAMAESALAAADQHAKGGPFALAGFSMGGYVALEILRRAASRVERLALVDTQATPDTPEATARRLGFIEQTKIGRFKGVQPAIMPMILHPSRFKDTSVTQPILDMALEVGAEGFVREQHATMGRADSRPMLGSIRVPTLVIVGRQDLTTPLARAEEMAATIPHARLVVIEECGHMSPLEKPAEVTAALRKWLDA